MYKGTTPTIILTFNSDVDFSEAKSVVVTFATDYHRVMTEKADEELEINANVIKVHLTQKETLAIKNDKLLVQVNVLYDDGNRLASDIKVIDWSPNLKGEIMV